LNDVIRNRAFGVESGQDDAVGGFGLMYAVAVACAGLILILGLVPNPITIP